MDIEGTCGLGVATDPLHGPVAGVTALGIEGMCEGVTPKVKPLNLAAT